MVRVDDAELPSAIPAFVEACGKLAGDAAALGELAAARRLLEMGLAACRADAGR